MFGPPFRSPVSAVCGGSLPSKERVRIPMNVIVWVLQACVGLIGGSCICAVSLYEDEQKRCQDWVEERWIHIDDRSKGAKSTFVGFTMEVSRIAEKVFARVFGPQVMSWRAV